MPDRTRRSTLVFARPFRLRHSDRTHPAGTYVVEVEEELLEGLSFPAYRHLATTMTRQSSDPAARLDMFLVDPEALAAAIRADGPIVSTADA
jgi:hypothetical protein